MYPSRFRELVLLEDRCFSIASPNSNFLTLFLSVLAVSRTIIGLREIWPFATFCLWGEREGSRLQFEIGAMSLVVPRKNRRQRDSADDRGNGPGGLSLDVRGTSNTAQLPKTVSFFSYDVPGRVFSENSFVSFRMGFPR